jgi:hypothetical protein
LPCGNYIFDYRNPAVTDWLLKYYILSPTALGSPAISGLFIDDFWCSLATNTTQECTDPVPGPSEVDPNNQVDTGLSNDSLHEITNAWLESMQIMQQAILGTVSLSACVIVEGTHTQNRTQMWAATRGH